MQTMIKKPQWRIVALLTVMVFMLQSSLFAALSNDGRQQESSKVTGKVTESKSGEAIPGVTIQVKGTSAGTISDIDGNYSLNVKPDDILVFRLVNYITQEISINGKTTIDMIMDEEVIGLDEIVVIGYGVQKKKLNTGANINVKGENIQALNTNSTMDALKGISPGLNITQKNGQSGSGTKVTIRGVGTIGHSEPLYIVDGIAVGDIDNLSPSDIESIDVLKDAASAAIYGSRAANGVILVATKKGKIGKPIITYDGYFGVQNVAKKPGSLNAQQYAEILNEGKTNDGLAPYTYNTLVPDWDKIESGEWTGTNWFDEITNKNAPVQSHAINISGGSEKSIYSFGASYLDQLGILGKQANSEYKRLNLRLNSEHVLIEKAGRDIVKFGENITFTNTKKPSVRTGSMYWSDIRNVLVASPFLPMYDTTGEYHYAIPWNTSESNPVALMEYNGKANYNNNNTIYGSAYLDIQPVKNLILHSSFGVNNWYSSTRQWIPEYNLSTLATTPRDQVDQKMNSGYEWTLTNTLSYSITKSLHSVSVVVGNELKKKESDLELKGHNENSLFQDAEHAYVDNIDIVDATYTTLSGHDKYGRSLMSYFGRLSYDYKETYLITFVYRADGSSNFDEGHRWGKFPSIAAGWVASNESWMSWSSNWLNFLKVRVGWGRNGNENIDPFQYLASLNYDQANYFFGTDKTIRVIGAYPPILPNPYVSWETSEQLDFGLDMNYFNNRLQATFDWYKKDTKDWLVIAPQLESYGTAAPYINGGQITNKGVELGLRWNDRAGDFKYGISGSLAYNDNEITQIANPEKIIHGPSNVLSQGTSEMFRAQVGYPVGYFWGYETDGILQNDAEVAAYVGPDGVTPYFTNSKPGDVRFVDKNNSGTINDSDKVMLGDPNPDFIFGIQLNAEYKGIYIQVTANGQSGNQIAKSYRSFGDSPKNNFTDDVYDRWHGEGTSDKMPILSSSPHRNTQYISDIYIEDGDFLRISNLTVGYDFKQLFKKWPVVSELRLYLTARNLYTFTKYSGMDPEVGYGPTDSANRLNDYPWASGIDLGLYPASRSYLIGLSIKF
jgi:TonB-linked SusC/RagA family outer membrane protein